MNTPTMSSVGSTENTSVSSHSSLEVSTVYFTSGWLSMSSARLSVPA